MTSRCSRCIPQSRICHDARLSNCHRLTSPKARGVVSRKKGAEVHGGRGWHGPWVQAQHRAWTQTSASLSLPQHASSTLHLESDVEVAKVGAMLGQKLDDAAAPPHAHDQTQARSVRGYSGVRLSEDAQLLCKRAVAAMNDHGVRAAQGGRKCEIHVVVIADRACPGSLDQDHVASLSRRAYCIAEITRSSFRKKARGTMLRWRRDRHFDRFLSTESNCASVCVHVWARSPGPRVGLGEGFRFGV
jgi:hypothetical protein